MTQEQYLPPVEQRGLGGAAVPVGLFNEPEEERIRRIQLEEMKTRPAPRTEERWQDTQVIVKDNLPPAAKAELKQAALEQTKGFGYDFKVPEELFWAIITAMGTFLFQAILQLSDPEQLKLVTDWKGWAIAILAGCLRAGMAAIQAWRTANTETKLLKQGFVPSQVNSTSPTLPTA